MRLQRARHNWMTHFYFSLSKEARYSKLRNLAFFYTREDATIWAHWNDSFHLHLSYLGQNPEFFTSWVPQCSDSVKVLHSICQQIWKTQQWSQDWKRSVFTPIPKGNVKECSNYHTIALISHTSKVMLKTLQARLQQYMNQEIPDVQAGFRKGICWIIGKAKEFQKTSTSASLTMLKLLTVWITANCRKFFKRWEYQTTLPASWESCMQVKK